MGKTVMKRCILIASVVGMGIVFSSNIVAAPAIGSLSTLKIDKAKAELGKRLFFDKRLSGDAAIACADCHERDRKSVV